MVDVSSIKEGLEEDTEPTSEESNGGGAANAAKKSRAGKATAKKAPAKTRGRGPGSDAGKKAGPSAEVIYSRISPELKRALEAHSSSQATAMSEVVEQAIRLYLFKQEDEVAWARSIARVDRRLGQLEQTMQVLMEGQLWFIRMMVTNLPPVPQDRDQKELWLKRGMERWGNFLQDMSQGGRATELLHELLERVKRRGQS